MREITQTYIQSLFEYRDGFLYWKNVNPNRLVKNGDKAGTLHYTEYYQIRINGKSYLSHRLIFFYHYGYLPKFIDHIDRNKSNNKIENLRESTQSQNCMNKNSDKNTSSQYKGVSWDKENNKWRSQIQINKKTKQLVDLNLNLLPHLYIMSMHVKLSENTRT